MSYPIKWLFLCNQCVLPWDNQGVRVQHWTATGFIRWDGGEGTRTVSLGLNEVKIDVASNAYFVGALGLWATTCVLQSQNKWPQVISSIFMFPFFSTSIRLLCSPPSGHNLRATVSL